MDSEHLPKIEKIAERHFPGKEELLLLMHEGKLTFKSKTTYAMREKIESYDRYLLFEAKPHQQERQYLQAMLKGMLPIMRAVETESCVITKFEVEPYYLYFLHNNRNNIRFHKESLPS